MAVAIACSGGPCTGPPNPHPATFFDLELNRPGVHETELALRMLPVEFGIPFHCRRAIRADLYHRDPIEDAATFGRMCLKGLDHEPLIGMSCTHVGPAH